MPLLVIIILGILALVFVYALGFNKEGCTILAALTIGAMLLIFDAHITVNMQAASTGNTPQPGEYWCRKGDKGDPFPTTMTIPDKVLDVRDGWVRYDKDILFPDMRTTLTTFTANRRRCPVQTHEPQPVVLP